jgi:hypothetical protein
MHVPDVLHSHWFIWVITKGFSERVLLWTRSSEATVVDVGLPRSRSQKSAYSFRQPTCTLGRGHNSCSCSLQPHHPEPRTQNGANAPTNLKVLPQQLKGVCTCTTLLVHLYSVSSLINQTRSKCSRQLTRFFVKRPSS